MKIRIILATLLFVFTYQTSTVFAAVQCDQIFQGNFVRYDRAYGFFDTMRNSTSKTAYLNSWYVDYINPEYLDRGQLYANGKDFDWTQQVKDQNYAIYSGQNIEILSTKADDWKIVQHPSTRTNATKTNFDFMVSYKIGYDFSNNYPDASDDVYHTECAYYSVTWCGDGVLDPEYETCDPNDPNHRGWGTGGCSQTQCTPINNPPTCDGLTMNPLSGSAPLNSTATCTGTNATSYTITCGNGQTINAATGTCTYTAPGTYTAQCKVNGTITSTACQKTVTVNQPGPSIDVDKRDQNPADRDGNVGNDTQTVRTGEKAVFKITVTNNGPEALDTLLLTDPVEPNCGGNVTLPGTYPSTWSNFTMGGSGNHSNNTLEPGESFSYTCEKLNTTVGYTNTVNVSGKGVTSGVTVTDTDPTVVVLDPTPTPGITIDKVDANSLDLDGNIGNDTQSVHVGDTAVFKIRVTNSGNEDLNTLVLTDAIAPNCGGNVTLPGTYPSTWSNFTMGGSGNHTDAILQVGEYFEYTCERGNSTADYTNTANVCGKGVTSGTQVCDDDPTDVQVGPIYDLALIKQLNDQEKTNYAIGEPVTFKITVYNQGEIAANSVTIIDYIPTGLTLSDTAWTQSGNLATRTISNIPVGGFKEMTITFTVNSSAAGTVINWAEISADDGDDIDSTPDQNNDNDCHGGLPRTQIDPLLDDKTNGKGDINNNGVCDAGEDEDDHDPAKITIGGTTGPAIQIDKTDANPSDLDGDVGGNDSQLVRKGNDAIFKIKVTNTGNEDLIDIVLTDAIAPNCAGSVTLPSTYPSTWSNFSISGAGNHTDNILQIGETFEYTCVNPNALTNYTNTAEVTAKGVTSGTVVRDDDPSLVRIKTSGGGSSSSGGSSNPSCLRIETNTSTSTGNTLDVEVTCVGNSKTRRFRIDCGNGQEITGDMNGSYKGTGVCNYTSGVKTNYAPKCYVGASTGLINITSLSCRKTITLGGPSYCGDGVLQRPNSNGEMEQCERARNADGSLGAFPDICTSQCRIRNTIPGECNTNACVITIPNEGVISFGPFDEIIIGNNMNPFQEIAQYPYMVNDSSYDLYFDELCTLRKSGTTLAGTTPQCKTVGEFYPGQKVVLSNADFKGNTAAIPAGHSFADNEVITTIRHEGEMYDWAYFAAHMKVRVSKPSVATTGGGTSYIKDGSNIANVTEVADGIEFVDKDENKNFVGTSVGGDLSSYTKDNVDQSIEDTVESEGQQYQQDIEVISYSNTGIGNVTSLLSVTNNFNGIKNVYQLKSGENLRISEIPATLSGPRTYIIEDADLVINGDLEYDDNIAFVVRGGNIQIDNNVKSIKGVYIAIPKNGVGGKIMGKSGTGTNNTLTVYGSLYGKIEELLNKRTYVRNNEDGQITVGTIVSFASGLFRKPAPLVSQFIEEYLQAEKVAK